MHGSEWVKMITNCCAFTDLYTLSSACEKWTAQTLSEVSSELISARIFEITRMYPRTLPMSKIRPIVPTIITITVMVIIVWLDC